MTEGETQMSKNDIPEGKKPVPIGKYLYLWLHRPGHYANSCIISAHGCYSRGSKYYQIPAGVRLHFYVDHGVDQPDFGLRNLILGKQPTYTAVGNGVKRITDYELSKYQGSHSGGVETYGSIASDLSYIDEYNEMAAAAAHPAFSAVDVITVRNRFKLYSTTMGSVISRVRQVHLYNTFHCFFCRGLA